MVVVVSEAEAVVPASVDAESCEAGGGCLPEFTSVEKPPHPEAKYPIAATHMTNVLSPIDRNPLYLISAKCHRKLLKDKKSLGDQ